MEDELQKSAGHAAQVSALRAELAESKAALAAQASAFDKERAALQAELDAFTVAVTIVEEDGDEDGDDEDEDEDEEDGDEDQELDVKILLLGLDGVGKTTLLYKQKLAHLHPHIIPTIGFNVESLEHSLRPQKQYTVWDIGGDAKLRPLWRHYTQDIGAVVFVVKAADMHRVELAKEALMGIMEDFIGEKKKHVPLAVVLHSTGGDTTQVDDAQVVSGLGLEEGAECLAGRRVSPVLRAAAYEDDAPLDTVLDWIDQATCPKPTKGARAQ